VRRFEYFWICFPYPLLRSCPLKMYHKSKSNGITATMILLKLQLCYGHFCGGKTWNFSLDKWVLICVGHNCLKSDKEGLVMYLSPILVTCFHLLGSVPHKITFALPIFFLLSLVLYLYLENAKQKMDWKSYMCFQPLEIAFCYFVLCFNSLKTFHVPLQVTCYSSSDPLSLMKGIFNWYW